MALTQSREVQKIESFSQYSYKVDGAVQTIYRGALVASDTTSGMLVNATDIVNLNFRGVAEQEIVQTVAVADGTNRIIITPQGSGKLVRLPIVSAVDETYINYPVYVVDDENVDLLGGVTNPNLVGIIKIVESANVVWVQI